MKVVIDGYAWLDLKGLTDSQAANLRNALTVYPSKVGNYPGKTAPDPIELYADRDGLGMIGVPRAFYRKNRKGDHEEDVRVSDGDPMSSFPSNMTFHGPFAEQEVALKKMMGQVEKDEWGGFLLKAGCGFGKTNVALEFARMLGRRTLIVVHKEFFLRQWRERIEKFFPGARVGVIQQDRCDYGDVDFVIGMMQSLSRDDGDRYPQEMYDAFGLVVSDECHRIGAQTWAHVVPRFSARWRLGLTATPRRKDDAEDVFFAHIGEILYSARTSAMIPKVRRMYTETELRPERWNGSTVSVDRLRSTSVVSQLCGDQFRTRQMIEDVSAAVAKGRKVMVVSERLEHLRKMTEDLTNMLMTMDLDFAPRIDFYTGEWFTGEKDSTGKMKKKSRSEEDLKTAESANVIMATKQMVEEGLDIQALDVLVLATPMSDVEQAVGRVRRWCIREDEKCERLCPWRAGKCEQKPHPIVLDVIDEQVAQAKRKWSSRACFYREIGAI